MKIIGNAEEARNLSTETLLKTRMIFEMTKNVRTDMQMLQSSFADAGYSEFEMVVNQVVVSINSHMEDVADFKHVLDQYAEILERQG